MQTIGTVQSELVADSGSSAGALATEAAASSSVLASRSFRFGLLFLLSMTEMMPVALLSRAMPVLLRRSGASMEQLGVLSLVMLPWAVKALWAPLVDKLGSQSRFGRYRSWLFVTHPLLLLTLLLGAFANIPALLSVNRSIGIPALVWLSIVSATADTASHGMAVNLLLPSERGLGNGVQNAGMMAGGLVGGGMMVILVGKSGWQPALLFMAGLTLLPLVGVFFYREAPLDPKQAITLREILTFFRRPRIVRWLILMSASLAIPSLPTIPFQALIVDHGLDLTEIGLMIGIFGSTIGILGGLLGGFIVTRFGRERSFYSLNILCTVCLGVSSVLLTRAHPSHWMIYAAVMLVYFGLSTGGTIFYVMIMDRSRGHIASTDYTIQYSLMQLCGFLGSSAGGFLAGWVGASPLFALVPILMCGVLLAARRLFSAKDFASAPS